MLDRVPRQLLGSHYHGTRGDQAGLGGVYLDKGHILVGVDVACYRYPSFDLMI